MAYTYKRNQKVSPTAANRTAARVRALGGSVQGVNLEDGITGAEARKVKRARRRQKYQLNTSRYFTGQAKASAPQVTSTVERSAQVSAYARKRKRGS